MLTAESQLLYAAINRVLYHVVQMLQKVREDLWGLTLFSWQPLTRQEASEDPIGPDTVMLAHSGQQ